MEDIKISYIIIAVTVLISMIAWGNRKMFEDMMFVPYLISKKNEWHRFVSSGFIHGDYPHLIFNMVSLLFLGVYAEEGFLRYFGEASYAYVFVGFYLSAIVVADIPIYFKYRRNPQYRALGASGAVSAVVFAAVLIDPNIRLIVFPIPIPIPGVVYALLYVLYSAYMARNSKDNIGHDAHLYGSLYGLVFIAITIPNTIQNVINSVRNLWS